MTVVVSRKTPLDGRLEISESLAQQLSSTDGPLTLARQGAEVPVTVEEMACQCPTGAGANHVHHFLCSDSLRSLAAGATVSLVIDVDRGTISIASND